MDHVKNKLNVDEYHKKNNQQTHLANITLIISDEAGFESLCLVAALCSVAHRVGEAGELSGCEQ